ncbi:amidophosphoribosyltransferase [Flavobacterium cyanobacteriorum]|uniref:Amidophosphoribosyltransferase n=1 Tax=Flavobacterium cyanobacteriorum TaxID=2022802 RepID=A0A255Z650_9FLAO|nr:double zinc ribbon domain-containing protein [Flavobacterium cyanobacteriorum]OYQ37013.1 amidophosphoribosyltransferase [Flavobacterium cyanobacteriorum]
MFRSLVNLLFPMSCPGCGGPLLENENTICTRCRHDMPLTLQHLMPENEMYRRFYGRLPVEHASAMVYFHKKDIVQEAIHNLKYRGREEVGLMMGRWYGPDLKGVAALQTVDDVVPVPLHGKKLRERGYNQVTKFGRAIAEALGANYNETILYRATYTKTQTKKNLTARAEIIGSAFDVSFTEADNCKHFLLVDDVITTGATLESCGKALLKIPGARLSIVTMAYAHS